MDFNVLQNVTIPFFSLALLPIQEISHLECKVLCIRAQTELSSSFVYDYEMSTSGIRQVFLTSAKEGGHECQCDFMLTGNRRGEGKSLKRLFDVIDPLNNKTQEQFSILLPLKMEVTKHVQS